MPDDFVYRLFNMNSDRHSADKSSTEKPSEGHDFSVVGIGASAGGIKALKQFFGNLPADSGMAYVVILHLSQQHESNLPAILQQQTTMPVTQVTETVKVKPNHVYVIPPAKHLEMVDGIIRLAEPQRVQGHRVPIDLFFRTLADAYNKRAVCIILSGTGSDGTLGLKRIKENDGIAIAQDPADAEYDSMPRNAISTGLVDIILPVSEMPEKLLALRRFIGSAEFPREKDEGRKVASEETAGEQTKAAHDGQDVLREILTLLRGRTGHDFFNYKRPTLLRRLARRMQVRELADLPAYLDLLREQPEEVQMLLRDLLITVTNFFRDKEAFEVLEREVVPRLFEGKSATDTLRVWIVGCATGDEAYSIAILLQEYAAQISDPPTIQIFASDINEEAIRAARECKYDGTIVADVFPERLRHYFVKEGEYYRVKKEIRELVLFAPHNVLRDPPFSRLDLISCRNLLIYLNRETQARVLELFSFALRRDGFLFLGAAETAESMPSLFSTFDKKHRIYKCSAAQVAHPLLPALPIAGKWEVRIPEPAGTPGDRQTSFGELHYKLVERYAPPSVLVNEEYDIVHASQHASRFLRFAGGEPSRNLLKVAHPAMQLDLRAALISARQENRQSISPNVSVRIEGVERLVNLIVRPAEFETEQGFFLVIFEELAEKPEAQGGAQSIAQTIEGDKAIESVVRRLEEELQQARDRLRSTIEQSETSTEELKASNEELQAMNEELRSASEELETSKEELQSVNEELTTVNHELKEKVDEISRSNSDVQNLMSSTDIATLFLDRALRIKRYTPRVQELFNIIPSDAGRPLEHLTHKLDYDKLTEDAAEVMRTLRTSERETRDASGRYYLVRLTPYRTVEDRIDGVVLSFLDVTELKHAAEARRESEERLSAIINQATAGIAQSDLEGKILLVNDRFCEITGYSRNELLGMRMQDITHPEDLPKNAELLKQSTGKDTPFVIERRFVRKDGSPVWVHNSVSSITDAEGKPKYILAVSLDITDRRRAEEMLQDSEAIVRQSNQELQMMYNTTPVGMCLIDRNFRYVRINDRLAEMNGIPAADHLGKTVREIVPTLADQVEPVFSRVIETGEPIIDIELTGTTSSQPGIERNWLESWYPQRDVTGAIIGVNVVALEITERKRMEKALQEADRRKDEFLATLAHELRNPLAAIRSAIDVLRVGDEEKREAGRQVIERQLEQVIRMVDDLLDISRITQGKIKLRIERISVASIIESALETTRTLFQAGQHELMVTLPAEPLYLNADPTRIAQVFLNLLTNSARYTDAGGKIEVSAERVGEQVVTSIKDTGIGISPTMLPHVFELFTQGVRASEKAQGGLGIGLSLVKKLTELHGGTVEAHSAGPGQGSEFIIRLPLAAEDAPLAPTPSDDDEKSRSESAPRRILVVDDNADSANMLEIVLTTMGHEVRLAYDGKTAIKTALEFQPELMFLDLGMPDIDGYGVAARIRPELPKMMLVALSGWGQDMDRQRTRQAGFDHHMVKPFNFDELPELLAAVGRD
jgi:two-component system CheB/CheR fusion protein